MLGSGIRLGVQAGGRFIGWPALRHLAVKTGDALITIAGNTNGNPVERGERRGETYAVPASVFLTQVINHATEHLSHNRTILSSNGIEPPEIDGLGWLETLSIPAG